MHKVKKYSNFKYTIQAEAAASGINGFMLIYGGNINTIKNRCFVSLW